MEINKRKRSALALLLALSLLLCSAPAALAKELLVGGQTVGIQVGTKGVLVASLTEVETEDGVKKPAESAGVRVGDIIEKINGKKLSHASELIDALAALNGKSAELTIRRGGETLLFRVRPVRSAEEQWMLGMWLRDSVSGIGTLTFCDPDSRTYGALGHCISESGSGTEIPIGSGTLTEAEVVGIRRGEAGSPGELNGCADTDKVLGDVAGNTVHGIYGRLHELPDGRSVETGLICVGPASLLCTVKGRECRAYSAEINRIYKDAEGEHVLLTVTDPELLQLTGGIVQGMSGSPILQNGKLVGAVTHVFVNDPRRGYGVSIQDMLTAAGLAI